MVHVLLECIDGGVLGSFHVILLHLQSVSSVVDGPSTLFWLNEFFLYTYLYLFGVCVMFVCLYLINLKIHYFSHCIT